MDSYTILCNIIVLLTWDVENQSIINSPVDKKTKKPLTQVLKKEEEKN